MEPHTGPQDRLTDVSVPESLYTDGFAILRGLVEPERLARLSAEADRLEALAERGAIAAETVRSRPTVDGGKVLERIDPFQGLSPELDGFCADNAGRAILTKVFGEEPQIFKDKLIFKRPGDKGYGLHQDCPYLEEFLPFPDSLYSLAVCLDPATRANGALCVYAGYHRARLPSPAGEARDVDPAQVSEDRRTVFEAQPGDAILFHSLTPHESGANQAAGKRRMLFLTYCPASKDHLRQAYYARFASGLNGGVFV